MRIRRTQKLKVLGAVMLVTAITLSPVAASAFSANANTTINVNVSGVITLTTDGEVTFNLTPTASGVQSNGTDHVKVSTNVAAGYTLTLADADATTNLANGGNTFGASSANQTTPAALSSGEWGYAVAGLGGFDTTYTSETNKVGATSKWAGVPATGSAATIASTTGTANNDETEVWYAAKANIGQAPGTYTDSVTYTATTKS